jgi:hypothetical protein
MFGQQLIKLLDRSLVLAGINLALDQDVGGEIRVILYAHHPPFLTVSDIVVDGAAEAMPE